MNPQFSICHTTARPNAWRKSYDLWIERAAFPESVEYVLCVDERWGFDPPPISLPMPSPDQFIWERTGWDRVCMEDVNPFQLGYSLNKMVWNTGRKCMVDGYAAAARASTGTVLIMNSDDMEPPEEWDAALLSAISNHNPDRDVMRDDFAIHVLTGYFDAPQASGIQILSRARYERLGYVFYPEYESLYADDDFLQHAYHDGVVIDARPLTFPHHHAERPQWDDVYRHQNRGESSDLGNRLLQRRVACGFQNLEPE
jgi:hypothetical protein